MKIFISYRRVDSSYVTDRIYDCLTQYCDKESVFRDIDSIHPGADFRKHLQDAINQCDVVLAVIGDRWLTIRNSTGTRRLDDPDDYVRIEIETALQRGIPLVPLLIENVAVPPEDALPPAISGLASRQGLVVRRAPDFLQDMERVIEALLPYGLSQSAAKNDDGLSFGELGM